MKTFDGAKLVLARRAADLQRYPAGSVSKRDVILTLPLGDDPEVEFAALDKRLTDTVYSAFQAANLALPAQYSTIRDELTKTVIAALTR